MPDTGPMKTMLIMMVLMIGLYMIDGKDHLIGKPLDFVFGFLAFDGKVPVLTLMLAGVIMALFTTLLRAFTTDLFEQAKSQHMMSEFNAERRKAMMANNTYAIKKLDELQPTMMAKNMEISQKSMKTMPYTMIVIIPLFLWVRYFINMVLTPEMLIIDFPWGPVGLLEAYLFPIWVFVYMLISIPLGQVISKIIRWHMFKKKLREYDENETLFEVV